MKNYSILGLALLLTVSLASDCQPGAVMDPSGTCHYPIYIDGCYKYASSSACAQCEYNYVKDGPRCVYSPTKNQRACCVQYSEDTGVCTKCASGLFLENGICKGVKILGCIEREADGCGCANCAKEFVLINERCVKTVQYCSKYNSDGTCKVCESDFHLGPNGFCVPNQQGCIEYQQGQCINCEASLYLSADYECIQKEYGCIYESGFCSSCLSPFSYNSDKRVCFIEGCQELYAKGCKLCAERFIRTDQSTCTLPYCLQMKNYRCLQCEKGYTAGENGLCHKEDPNCQTYDRQFNCIQCVKGNYMNAAGKCILEKFGCNYVDARCVSCRAPFTYDSETESCEIDGCTKYFLGGCKQCGTGYDLRYNSCKLPHCLISYKGQCKQCDPDFIMRSDGTCVNKDEFCYSYNSQGFCTECAPKYHLSSIKQKCIKRQPGCLYNAKDECHKCEKPFYFDGVRCEIHGCMALDYDGCKECFYPMRINVDKLCQVENCDRMEEGVCVVCISGFAISEDGSCKMEDPKCLLFKESGAGCKKCHKGYRVDDNGRCQYADEHCWDFTEKGHCQNCDRLYFLNQFKKCQLKDTNCYAYANGYCQECRDNYYTHRGLCFPNAKGCLVQKNIKECVKCGDGYEMEYGKCTPQITKLSWNSIDMDFDFFGGQTDEEQEEAEMIFTLGKDNKKNLEPSLTKGGKQFYSKSDSKYATFQVESEGEGWFIKDQQAAKQQYAGVSIPELETFYAVDIKSLAGNSLTKISIEYSEDGQKWKQVKQYELIWLIEGAVETIYFSPVYAVAMRIVVVQGAPNIKFQFYFNGNRVTEAQAMQSDSYISDETMKAVQERMASDQIKVFVPESECVDKELCWMGLQLYKAKDIYGFGLIPSQDNQGSIEEVYLDYSVDGVKYECYNECNPIRVRNNRVKLTTSCIGSKFRVHLSKWQGKPSFGIKFDYQHY